MHTAAVRNDTQIIKFNRQITFIQCDEYMLIVPTCTNIMQMYMKQIVE